MAKDNWSVIATVPSSSDPDKVYEIKERNGIISCSCPIWKFNKRGNRTCKHTDSARNNLGAPTVGGNTDVLDDIALIGEIRMKEKEQKPKKTSGKVNLISPMLAAKGDALTILRLYHDKNWVAERKLDGGRYVLYIRDDGNRLFSRKESVVTKTLVEKTENVPHITGTDPKSLDGTVLDGEITVPNADFGGVISVMVSSPAEAAQRAKEGLRARYNVFDCPVYKGRDITGLPLRERREYVEKAVAELGNPDIVAIEQRMTGKQEWYQEIVESGGEGIILKDLDGRYYPGQRGSGWIKVKKHRTYDVIVTGFEDTDSETFRAKGWIGAVKFGVYDAGTLREIGRTSGMTQAVRDDMSKNPKKYLGQVMEVEGQEVLRDGIRHPRFVRMRPDANPRECTWEKVKNDGVDKKGRKS